MLDKILRPWRLTKTAYVGRHRASTRWGGPGDGFIYIDETTDADDVASDT